VGLYATAVALSGHLRRVVLQSIKDVLGSRLPSLVGDHGRLTETIATASRHTVLLVLLPSAALALVGYPVILLLYGARFAGSYEPLLILLPGSLFWSVAVIVSYWFIGANRFVTLTVVGLFIAGTNIALNIAFVPRFGMHAAAATSTFCYALHLGLFLTYVARRTGRRGTEFLLPRREDLRVYSEILARAGAFLRRAR
jgi:O-antigen/teichoic acid export membrane protein